MYERRDGAAAAITRKRLEGAAKSGVGDSMRVLVRCHAFAQRIFFASCTSSRLRSPATP